MAGGSISILIGIIKESFRSEAEKTPELAGDSQTAPPSSKKRFRSFAEETPYLEKEI